MMNLRGLCLTIFILSTMGSVSPMTAQPVAATRPDAPFAAEYEKLRLEDRAQARDFYDRLPRATRQGVWTLHLVTFLSEHPELSDEQRDVVLQALGLLATGVLEIEPSDPRWRSAVHLPMTRILDKARSLLPRELVRAAFYTLDQPTAPAVTSRSRLVEPVTHTQKCNCASIENYCDDERFTCRTGGPSFCSQVPWYDCGPFYAYACDGVCGF